MDEEEKLTVPKVKTRWWAGSLNKHPLHVAAETFRDEVVMYLQRTCFRGVVENWTYEVIYRAALELARIPREKIHVHVMPGLQLVTLTTETPKGTEITPLEDHGCVVVLFLPLDPSVPDGTYVKLSLLEGGPAIIEDGFTVWKREAL